MAEIEIEVDNSLLVPIGMVEYTDDCNQEESENNLVYCPLCHVNFFDASEFEAHNIALHEPQASKPVDEIKKYACIHCNSSFRRHDHLKRHVNSVHSTGLKLHKCPICEDDFTRRDVLLKHVRKKHADARSFSCITCSFTTETFAELEAHNMSHLPQDAHICSFCKKPFKRRDHMLRHIKTLHLNQYTVCPICCQQFKRKDHVRRHCREKHKMEIQNGKIVRVQEDKNGISNNTEKS